MPWLIPILTKLAWWLLPKLLGKVVDAFETTLRLVEEAEAKYELPAARRDYVVQRMPGIGAIPEIALRFVLELAVTLRALGVNSAQLDKMEQLASQDTLTGLLSTEKRALVLDQFKTLFPDLPERIGRLLLEVAVAKVKAGLRKGAA